MAIQPINPSAATLGAVERRNTNRPSSEEEKLFASLLAGKSLIKPEKSLVEMLHKSDLFASDALGKINKTDFVNPEGVLRTQLLMARFQIAYNFGAKVVGSISQSINKLDTMS